MVRTCLQSDSLEQPSKKSLKIKVSRAPGPCQVGTVNPILPVVAELVQRKCDVRYYLSKESGGGKSGEGGGWWWRWWLEDHPRTCKWFVTPIFKPWKGHLEREQPYLGWWLVVVLTWWSRWWWLATSLRWRLTIEPCTIFTELWRSSFLKMVGR